jgi:hypothetical protein
MNAKVVPDSNKSHVEKLIGIGCFLVQNNFQVLEEHSKESI